MSTTTVSSFSAKPRFPRTLPRFNVAVPLDVSVLRSGIPDRIPGRSVDINDRGLGLVVAGELFDGESVGVEFWLPNIEQPVRARGLVRHQHQLRCGLEFLELSAEQQSLIRLWTLGETLNLSPSVPPVQAQDKAAELMRSNAKRRIFHLQQKIRRYRFRIAVLILMAAVLGWWRWQRGWTEIEAQLPAKPAVAQPQLIVAGAEMEQRITHKVDPVYPDAAREAHLRGVVVLHAVIGSDGTVARLETLRGPKVLAQAAMDAARWWRYEPYLLNGQAVEVETTLEVPFNDYRISRAPD
jgi:TonB family protein